MSDDITQVRRAWESEVSELMRVNSALRAKLDAAQASHEMQQLNTLAFKKEADWLREVIRKFREGEYAHPRSYKPDKCPHRVYYWADCDQCDEEYWKEALGDE